MTNSKIEQFKKSISHLANCWQSLASKLEIETNVSLESRHRMVACAHDIIAFSNLFNNSYLKKEEEARKTFQETKDMNIEQLSTHWAQNSNNSIALMHQLSSAYKAMYFFIRALQDACCAIYFELTGNQGSTKSGMNRTKLNNGKKVREEITKYVPNYNTWFKSFTDTRNRIKEGVSQGCGYSEKDGLEINLHIIRKNESSATIDIKEKIKIEDITYAIEISSQLFKYLEICST